MLGLAKRVIGIFFLLVSSLQPLFAQQKPSADPARTLLSAGEKLLQENRKEGAVRTLRQVIANYPDSASVIRARELLARLGYGFRTQVTLKERQPLLRQQIVEGKIVHRLEEVYKELWVFFRQTFPRPYEQEFLIIVYDSRARYRNYVSDAKRRSARRSLPQPGPSNLRLAEIAVFYDSRQGEDAVEILLESAAREIARSLLQGFVKRPLPEVWEYGVSEYLALRLFPNPLRIRQTQEDLMKAVAREGLRHVREFSDFQAFLSQEVVASSSARQNWERIGLSYAVVDTLINGISKTSAGAGRRNLEFQEFLRGLGNPVAGSEGSSTVSLAQLEALLKRHFGLTLQSLHQGLVGYVRSYPPREPDFDRFSEL